LRCHAGRRRSGDQVAIYICDRFVVPYLSRDDLDALARGERFLDGRARDYIHDHLTYCVLLTDSGATAERWRILSAGLVFHARDVR
jgi:hypothetical protein